MNTMKYIMIISIILISGCATQQTVEFVEVAKPILTCPPPPGLERPDLALSTIQPGNTSTPGEVVKRYKATIIQLQKYAEELEIIVERYEEVSKNYAEAKRLVDAGHLPMTIVDEAVNEDK